MFAGNAAPGQPSLTQAGTLTGHVYERSNRDAKEASVVGDKLNAPRMGPVLLFELQYGGTISGKVEDAEHAKQPASQSSNQITGFTFNLPTKTTFSLGSAPNGWTMTEEGKTITATGPPSQHVFVRLDHHPVAPYDKDFRDWNELKSHKLDLRVTFLHGEVATLRDLPITSLPTISLRTPGDALTLPPTATTGRPVFATPLPRYDQGAWHVGDASKGSTWGGEEPTKDLDGRYELPEFIKNGWGTPSSTGVSHDEAFMRDVLDIWRREFFTGPPVVIPVSDQPITITHTNAWGEEDVRGQLHWTNPLPFTPGCTPQITGGTATTIAGQSASVTGCFSGVQHAFGLNLDGKTPLKPQAASQTAIVVQIPPDTVPGHYSLQFLPSLGGTGALPIDVVQLQASINQDELWRGQSTTATLRIVGSTKSLPLRITNETPDTIDVQGGLTQTIMTPGGTDNVVTRQVTGLHRGDFEITARICERIRAIEGDASVTLSQPNFVFGCQ
jgi:hypothetical protein